MRPLLKRTPDCNLELDSLILMFEDSFKRHWEFKALSDYKGTSITYQELATRIEKVHILLSEAGIVRGDRVALCGKNCLSWGVAFFGVFTYGAVPVPILNDFKPGNIHTIVNHSEAKLLMVGDVVLQGMVFDEMPAIDGIVLMDDMSLQHCRAEKLAKAFENLESIFNEKYPNGFTKDDIHYEKENSPEDMCVLNYTSGTTSDPKGVMIPYRALQANCVFACRNIPLKSDETVVSILPMAHMFGLTFQLMFELMLGSSVCYLGKAPTPAILFGAFAEAKPTLVLTVPLVIEKVIKQKIMPVLAKPSMKILLAIPGVRNIILGKIRTQILAAFGGKVDEVVIGGAAINPEVEKILRMMKFPYTVGYGSTECAPLISYADYETYEPGSCGRIINDCKIEVVGNGEEEVGELVVSGPIVMLGYYKNEAATKAVIDSDGRFHTGDLGVIDAKGNIFIKGRCKTMILGPSGQNIYPEEIEAMLDNEPLISESLVVSRDGKLVALVLPDADASKGLDVPAEFDQIKKKLNALLPNYSQLATFEIRTEPFERTPKRSIRRFLYS